MNSGRLPPILADEVADARLILQHAADRRARRGVRARVEVVEAGQVLREALQPVVVDEQVERGEARRLDAEGQREERLRRAPVGRSGRQDARDAVAARALDVRADEEPAVGVPPQDDAAGLLLLPGPGPRRARRRSPGRASRTTPAAACANPSRTASRARRTRTGRSWPPTRTRRSPARSPITAVGWQPPASVTPSALRFMGVRFGNGRLGHSSLAPHWMREPRKPGRKITGRSCGWTSIADRPGAPPLPGTASSNASARRSGSSAAMSAPESGRSRFNSPHTDGVRSVQSECRSPSPCRRSA